MQLYRISEYIDISSVDELLRDFQPLVDSAILLLDNQGEVLTACGWQKICLAFHQADVQSPKCLGGCLNNLEYPLKAGLCSCKFGLQIHALPITIEGQLMGTLVMGPFLSDYQDELGFGQQARALGLDEGAYIGALKEVPRISGDRIVKIESFLSCLVRHIASMGAELYHLLEEKNMIVNQDNSVEAIESNRDVTTNRTADTNPRKELHKFRVLYDLAVAITAENSLEENLALVVEKSQELLGTDSSFIGLRDDDKGEVFIHTVAGITTDRMKTLRMPFGVGLGGLVAANREGMIVEHYIKCQDIIHEVDNAIQIEGLVSGIAAPIQMGRKNLGVLYVFNRTETHFTTEDLETLTLLGNLAAVEISRRYTEDDLRESKQQMEDIISFLPDATFSIDREGRVITWNKAAEDLTGIKASNIVGKNNYEHGFALYKQKRPTLVDLVLLADSEVDADYPNIRRESNTLVAENFCAGVGKNGAYLWGKASCLYDGQGRVVGAIESVRDITEPKLAEQALRESEQRLADIINFLPDPTLVIDREGIVIAWNRAFEEMTGVPASEMVGKGNYEYALPFYGKRQPVLIDFICGANPKTENSYSIIHKDKEKLVAETSSPSVKGKPAFLWGKATPLYNSQNELVGAIESIRDITQRKESEDALQESYSRLERILEGAVTALGTTAEKRDPYTAGHQRRVAQLAVSIANKMNLPTHRVDNIRTAAALHDIGKIYIPAEILSKPGKLTEIEWLLIKTHPEAGYDIMKAIPFAGPIDQILIQHHERLDGSGYPCGLSGSEILLEARIVAVADVVEAMSSHRPYRPAFAPEEALREVVKFKGILYDPEVVKACIEVFKGKEFAFN